MARYIIVNKEDNSIKTLFEFEGEYLIDNMQVMSKKVPPTLNLDFTNNSYYYDESIIGNLRVDPKIKERNDNYEVFLDG